MCVCTVASCDPPVQRLSPPLRGLGLSPVSCCCLSLPADLSPRNLIGPYSQAAACVHGQVNERNKTNE